MQLSKIKIAGFKSFVDPTTIELPSTLVAVVGPNGCGKSNIIDAVTWVMGESSPKYLRGQSSTDVIFNGSNARKPIGQASVELVFDNSDGTIGGEFAKYAEISVKRLITRDADSSYFLNGTRVRKRDVVDIFLGTGLGPRSYSIIGQNMITRIVEAKPEDLRGYLEEAAGISKYKERRHETELRIKHTQENLSRVNDVCVELDKQLTHLKHQASVAEKFKVLKEEERTLRAELYAAEWRDLDSKMSMHTLKIQQEETALEAKNSELTHVEQQTEAMRLKQRGAHDALQEVQRRYYVAGNEITRLEQAILHHEERHTQWVNDLKQTDVDWQTLSHQLTEAKEQLEQAESVIHELTPSLEMANQEAAYATEALNASEENLHAWQMEWDAFNAASAQSAQTAQVEKTQIQHLEQRIAFLKQRETQLLLDQGRINFAELNEDIASYELKSENAKERLGEQKDEIDETRHEIAELQTSYQHACEKLDGLRRELQQLLGQEASLQALQKTALGKESNGASTWLEKNALTALPRLAEKMTVETGWEVAVEKVLGVALQAICVKDLTAFTEKLDALETGNVCLLTENGKSAEPTSKKGSAPLLLEKIQTTLPMMSLLSGVYVAETPEEAMVLAETLAPHESVITRSGLWVSRSWLKALREEDLSAGIFAREQTLKMIEEKIHSLTDEKSELEARMQTEKNKLMMCEETLETSQHAYNQLQSQSAQLTAQFKAKEERFTELKTQADRLSKDILECRKELEKAEAALEKATILLEQAVLEVDEQTGMRDVLLSKRDAARAILQQTKEAAHTAREKEHAHEMQMQAASSQQTSLLQNIDRMQTHVSTLHERKNTLQNELTALASVDTLKASLLVAIDQHNAIETDVQTARAVLDTLEEEMRGLDDMRHAIDKTINQSRATLEALRVEWQGWKVKSDTLLEQMQETNCQLEQVLQTLAEDISLPEWRKKLEQVVSRINRLGPINLVAIEEYATCLERKEYLDKQVADLQAGLQTLADAIAKIDKETKQRFKDTFDKVNLRFQELFPTVFGGGKAYLDLNSEDLLEAGVTMMAMPPGKRNSTIQLLSGGEKSLTAIALVFSIFHLNPAPFCLLDEVDAALDDTNVLRFTRLVKVMANKTQFIFISHNKLTIEMGHHLIGVTMNEPGVSRLVSVDIEKAVEMAG